MTSTYLATYNIGFALGHTVSGAMWQHLVPDELRSQLGSADLAAQAYADPFTFATEYPVGTPQREAVALAYRNFQRLLCFAGICLSFLLVAFSLVTRNPELGKEQSLEHAEEQETARTDR